MLRMSKADITELLAQTKYMALWSFDSHFRHMFFSPFPITEIYIFMYIFAKWDNCQLLLSAKEGKQAEKFNCFSYVLVQVKSFYCMMNLVSKLH